MVEPHSPDPHVLARAAARVADRWSLLIVAAMLNGATTFSELSEHVNGIAPNILTARLRQLERDGLIAAHPYSQRPARVRYELTTTGRELTSLVAVLSEWGARQEGGESTRTHHVCGTGVEMRAYCPTCERVLDDEEFDDVVWL